MISLGVRAIYAYPGLGYLLAMYLEGYSYISRLVQVPLGVRGQQVPQDGVLVNSTYPQRKHRFLALATDVFPEGNGANEYLRTLTEHSSDHHNVCHMAPEKGFDDDYDPLGAKVGSTS